MWNRIRQWWRVEGDLAQLQGVSDRMLEDMGLMGEGPFGEGLTRGDLRALVLGRKVAGPGCRACPPVAHLARS